MLRGVSLGMWGEREDVDDVALRFLALLSMSWSVIAYLLPGTIRMSEVQVFTNSDLLRDIILTRRST